MADEEATIKIDDKEYNLGDLSETAKEQLLSMRAAEQQIEAAKTQLAIATTARNAYATALREELAEDA
jgi:hypothetical protein